MNAGYLLATANHLWQSTLFATLAGLLTLAFRENRARVRHAIWLAASCKFLVPLSWLVALGGQVRWRTAAESAPSSIAIAVEAGGRFVAPVVSAHTPVTPSSSMIPAALWAIWACGFVGIACTWWIRWMRIQAVVRNGTVIEAAIPIPVICSPVLGEPGVFGLLSPVLILPEGICERLTPEQLDAVTAHEMCHVRHSDNVTAALHMAVETVFWFHPLLWWIGKRMVEEREQACDEEVLRMGHQPRTYADAILCICKLYVQSPLVCVAGVAGPNLKRRIVAIMHSKTGLKLGWERKAVLAICAAAALAAPIAVGIVNAPAINAQALTNVARFHDASVRSCTVAPNTLAGSGESSPGRLSTGCLLLADTDNTGLIQRAYVRFAGGHPHPFGIVPVKGGPDWIHSEMFDISAKAEGSPSAEMMQGPILQAVLEDRFRLKIQRQTTVGPVYALRASGETNLKPFQEGSCTRMPLTFPPPELPQNQRYCKTLIALQPPAVHAEGNTLGELSKLLDLLLDRPVLDQTGIAGNFDIQLDLSAGGLPMPSESGIMVPALPPRGAAPEVTRRLTNAVQASLQKIGLRLEPAEGPIESLVIDHVERPPEN